MRSFILDKAELAGLDRSEIEAEDAFVGVGFPDESGEIEDLGLPSLNAFEKLVEK